MVGDDVVVIDDNGAVVDGVAMVDDDGTGVVGWNDISCWLYVTFAPIYCLAGCTCIVMFPILVMLLLLLL